MTVIRRSFKIGPNTRRKQQKAATRERILQAARELFAEHGYDATTMQKIAHATELSTGNVFVHFPSKADVLATLMHDDIAALDEIMANAMPLRGTMHARLLKMFGLFLDQAVPTERLLRALLAYSWSWDEQWERRFEGGIVIRRQHVRRVLEDGVLAGELRQEADLETLGVCVVGIAETLFKSARFHAYDRRRFLEQADRALQILLEGAVATATGTKTVAPLARKTTPRPVRPKRDPSGPRKNRT